MYTYELANLQVFQWGLLSTAIDVFFRKYSCPFTLRKSETECGALSSLRG